MVGLSIVLETHQKTSLFTCVSNNTIKNPQVINKTNMILNKPYSSSPFSPPSNLHSCFLEHCFLCGQKLLPGKDIYMYKGDRGFCSVECRYRQMFMDEEDCFSKENCSFEAIEPTSSNYATSSNSNSFDHSSGFSATDEHDELRINSSSGSRQRGKASRNRANGFVAY